MADPAAAGTTGDPSRGPGWPRGNRRAALVMLARALLVAVCVVLAYYLLPMDRPGTLRTVTVLVGGVLAVLLVFAWEVRTIIRSPYPRLRAVEALITTLVLFLVVFASVYYLLERASPGSFSEPLTRTDALYFALTTFATVGFGDIVAVTQAGRVVAMLQMAGGLLLAGVAARILTEAIRTGLGQRRDRGAGGPDATGPDDRS
ncbi:MULTISPECIES: potassium channel family protein [unclassified Streptomyces]|uniref:potassium channel family protein n=1 Tax=unclassified Streptomyces TaxID=2593676 RepID=UPI0009A0F009|nr:MULTISPECIES: potassium channel family protein [unclassified Streptomyces]